MPESAQWSSVSPAPPSNPQATHSTRYRPPRPLPISHPADQSPHADVQPVHRHPRLRAQDGRDKPVPRHIQPARRRHANVCGTPHPPLTRQLSFWSYDMAQKLVRVVAPGDGGPLSLTQLACAGALSAIPTTVITTPMERVKVVMQTQGQDGAGAKSAGSGGMVGAVRTVYRQGGMASLYRGTVATLMRDIPGT